MYFISEKEVNENFEMKTAIQAVREAFEEYHKGRAGSDPRSRIYSNEVVLNSMPAYMEKYRIAGMKTYIASKEGARFVVLLFDTGSMELLAVIEANRLGQLRTGAVTALATSLLHERCEIFTLIGSGYQAETQLEGILNISSPEEIRIYSRNYEHSKAFSIMASRKFDTEVKAYRDLKRSLESADVISTITSSRHAVIKDLSFLREYHLNLAGANLLSRREASDEVLRSADLVVTEQLEQSLKESSEITGFLKAGRKVAEFKDVVGEPSRYSNRKKTVFKSMGIGLEDIASGYYILKRMGLV